MNNPHSCAPWTLDCDTCGHTLNENDPVLPLNRCGSEPGYCRDCWAKRSAEAVADEPDRIALCPTCDGEGVVTTSYPHWKPCGECNWQGFIDLPLCAWCGAIVKEPFRVTLHGERKHAFHVDCYHRFVTGRAGQPGAVA